MGALDAAPLERFSDSLARALEDIGFLGAFRRGALRVGSPMITNKGQMLDLFGCRLLQNPEV